MSLNWSAKDVKEWEHLKEIELFDNILEIIVFDTMNVGIPKLTHGNVQEFYRRMCFMRLSRGQNLQEFIEFLPLELLERFIGLGTNASSKTVTQFNKDVLGELEWKTKSAIESYSTKQEG